MAQFTKYYSSDAGAPSLDGTAGTLIAVLDAILVTGYGAKSAAGWSHPVATAGNIATYQQAAGSGFTLLVNDNGPNVTSTTKEAWLVGWESCATVGAPVGTGSGQFPLPAQLLTTGHMVCRKSNTADGTVRQWKAFADDRTIFFFAASGDTAGVYFGFFFGDVFSMAGGGDTSRCILYGSGTENSALASSMKFDTHFQMSIVPGAAGNFAYMARTYSGAGSSIQTKFAADMSKSAASGGTSGTALAGTVQTPNGPDNSYYLSPIWVAEESGTIVRGRMRGLYEICHALAGFADGNTFSGAGDFAGKSFEVVLKGINNGFWAIETSNTLETN